MARIRKRGKVWAVEFRRKGHKPEHATFPTRHEAAAWRDRRELEHSQKALPTKTLADALREFDARCKPDSDAGRKWQTGKIRNFLDDPISAKPLASLTRNDFANWRDARLSGPRLRGKGTVKGATVNRELNLLSAVLTQCAGDWEWLHANPMRGLVRPPDSPSRRRRIPQADIDAICKGLGYEGGKPEGLSQRVALAFLFALETAMRGGEIVRIRPAHCGPVSVHVPKSKNGTARDVPLTPRAQEILELVGKNFGLNDQQRETTFRAGRDRTTVQNLHFHDSRAEGIYRLSRKLNVLELARAVGQKDIKSLMYYYETTAEEMAARLA